MGFGSSTLNGWHNRNLVAVLYDVVASDKLHSTRHKNAFVPIAERRRLGVKYFEKISRGCFLRNFQIHSRRARQSAQRRKKLHVNLHAGAAIKSFRSTPMH